LEGVLAFLKALGPARLGAMGAVAAVLILRVSQPDMAPLFADLALEDAAAATRELDKLGVRYELRDERTILVPKADVARGCGSPRPASA
jgi:flagellar M-ring protein FliF